MRRGMILGGLAAIVVFIVIAFASGIVSVKVDMPAGDPPPPAAATGWIVFYALALYGLALLGLIYLGGLGFLAIRRILRPSPTSADARGPTG